MNLNRRDFFWFVGAGTSAIALKQSNFNLKTNNISKVMAQSPPITEQINFALGFQPVKIPIPLTIDPMPISQQKQDYQNYQVQDDLVLPPGFTYEVLAVWGDPIGNSRFGYNNDYLSLIETTPHQGYLTINFEYISGGTWMQTYPLVIGKGLPFDELIAAAQSQSGELNAFDLQDDDPLKDQIKLVARESLIDLGLGIISVKSDADGQWQRTYAPADRRVTGISGLEIPEQALKSTGDAVAVFTNAHKIGYEDNLGDRIIGTFQNCSGGVTPWGTVLSAEENFQDQVPEEVMADGSSFLPQAKPFLIDAQRLAGAANVFGLAGNKYGWLVEIDPANPQDYGTKHTWLGRYRHEAFGIRAGTQQKLVVYSGCDRRGGHLYKFVSHQTISDPQDKANSELFESGMLYGAKLYPHGIGEWIPLSPDTLINPVLPSQVIGNMVTLPNRDRPQGGIMKINTDEAIQPFIAEFQTLRDLYWGNTAQEIQGAILIDAHFAATAIGITCLARPESTIIHADGSLLIAFTSGLAGSDGGADKAIFIGPNGEADFEYGWIMKLMEDDADPSALSFTWTMVATGGEPASGGIGWANPDNLALDQTNNLWIATDISTQDQNAALPWRTEAILPHQDLTGIFGNNSLWYMPLTEENTAQAYPFAIAPMECEFTGMTFDQEHRHLFLSIQHPGEANGIRQNMAQELREFELLTTDGQTFRQQRQVPIGSNWPSGEVNQPPLPGIAMIRRQNNQPIV